MTHSLSSALGADNGEPGSSSLPLSLHEYRRYGRQMILPQLGLGGQVKLKQASVLVVGAGGLGCPAIQYLAAAGVGHITAVDHDTVETSNLARQILHTDERVGMNKAKSAAIAATQINPHVRVDAITEQLSVGNATDLVRQHDIVLDCTDNVLTRYLISDAAVLCGRQVVSGAAQGLDGQLVVLHKDLTAGASASGVSTRTNFISTQRGPCYRCLFPRAPKPEDVTDCEDGGVLGGVTGLVGTLQALESVKLLAGLGDPEEPPNITLVSPLSFPPFRSIKIRPRRTSTCRSCGLETEMSKNEFAAKIGKDLAEEEYITFCGLDRPARGSKGFENVSVGELQNMGHTAIIDVRPPVEFEIAHLPGSKNIPLRTIDADPAAILRELSAMLGERQGEEPVLVLCRKGNDSRIASEALNAASAGARSIRDPNDIKGGDTRQLVFANVLGGLRAWSEQVDPSFPIY